VEESDAATTAVIGAKTEETTAGIGAETEETTVDWDAVAAAQDSSGS
jgi:hypothetical protein